MTNMVVETGSSPLGISLPGAHVLEPRYHLVLPCFVLNPSVVCHVRYTAFPYSCLVLYFPLGSVMMPCKIGFVRTNLSSSLSSVVFLWCMCCDGGQWTPSSFWQPRARGPEMGNFISFSCSFSHSPRSRPYSW